MATVLHWSHWLYGTDFGHPKTRREAMFRWCLRRHGYAALPDWVVRVPGCETRRSEFILLVVEDLSRLPDDAFRALLPKGSVVVITGDFACARHYAPTEITGVLVANIGPNYREEGERLETCSVFQLPYLAVDASTPGPEHIQQLLAIRNATRRSVASPDLS